MLQDGKTISHPSQQFCGETTAPYCFVRKMMFCFVKGQKLVPRAFCMLGKHSRSFGPAALHGWTESRGVEAAVGHVGVSSTAGC